VESSIDGPETLGLVLREARHRHNLSQEELARRLGISQRYVSELEAGKSGILMKRLFQIMLELDVSLTAEIRRSHDGHE
jgi:HTH-type transcriptional regulator / antitoxin HipB